MPKRIFILVVYILILPLLFIMLLPPDTAEAGIYNASTEVTYKEYWVEHTTANYKMCDEDTGQYIPSVIGPWFLEPVNICVNGGITVTLEIPDDFSQALKAEIYIDFWNNWGNGGRYRINNGPTIQPPSINFGRIPYITQVPLSNLTQGTNVITFWTTRPFGYHVRDVAIRIYYDQNNPLVAGPGSDVTPPTGQLTSIVASNGTFLPTNGGALVVDNDQLTLSAIATASDTKFVEFHGFYYGYDEDNNGQLTDWHNLGRHNFHPGGFYEKPYGGTINHIGTDTTSPYNVTWDLPHIQNQSGVKFKIRVVDTAGNVREAAGGVSADFTLARSDSVEAYVIPPTFQEAGLCYRDFDNGGVCSFPDSIIRSIDLPADVSDVSEAYILGNYWYSPKISINSNPNFTAFIKPPGPFVVEGGTAPLSIKAFPPSYLQGGANQIRYTHNNDYINFGNTVERPGPMIVLRRPQPVVSYTLQVTTVGNGTVAVEPTQPGPPYEYLYGTVVTLTATPTDGFFVNWSGDLSGNNLAETLTIVGNHAVTATFAEIPTIDIWYGSNQKFGQIGNPQRWVNILGKVSPRNDIASLVYSLNGGAERSLSIGRTVDKRRLAAEGDFNIDIPITNTNQYLIGGFDLPITDTYIVDGLNEIVITATHNLGYQVVETVTVDYSEGNIWPEPYSIDWSTVSNLTDAVQVVDGLWELEADSIRPVEFGYDRLVAIGDVTWDDYEVTVPITVHEVNPNPPGDGNSFPSNGPGVGILMRWWGHHDIGQPQWVGRQPAVGWWPIGALGWYRWAGGQRLNIMGNNGQIFDNDTGFTLNVATPYIFKMRAETIPGGSRYSLKVWEDGNPEPSTWNLIAEPNISINPPHLMQGSTLLVAHHVDASFGDVTVTPLSVTSTLTVTTVGNGVVTVEPNQAGPPYEYPDNTVVTLTAVATPGWAFAGWSGDLSGNVPAQTLTMNTDKVVTATFTEITSKTLNVATTGNGVVTVDPNQPGPPYEYSFGTVVTLTAIASPGWIFSGWGDDLSGSTNPIMVTMTNDITATAIFTENISGILSDDFNSCTLDTSLWTFIDPYASDPDLSKRATLTMTGADLIMDVPGGVSHDIWPPAGNLSVRVVQPANNTDFELEAKFDSIVTQQYQAQGILIEQDDDNFIRSEVLHDGSLTRVFVATFNSGSPTVRQNLVLPGGTPPYMRMTRVGNVWTYAYSYNGVTWINSVSFTHNLTVNQVGPYGANAPSNSPAHTAIIDYFYNSTNPGTGDVDVLTINVSGNGSVAKNPDQANYTCGQAVQLTANPDPGWSFDGWSGDLTGSTNPDTLTINSTHEVTATFVRIPGVIVSPISLDIAEGGVTDTYEVVLTSIPTATVTINVNADSQSVAGPSVLNFDSGNWNISQTVTITAVDDLTVEGLHSSTISHSVSSADDNYNSIGVADVTVTITDNDSPGVNITETGGSTNITEGGTTDSYQVVLTRAPTATVTITVNFDSQSTAGPTSLNFDGGNWNISQTVTITAVDDLIIEGPHISTISHVVSSASNYNGVAVADVTANVTDNDAAAVIITETGSSTNIDESGVTDTYEVVLARPPTATVTINVYSDSQSIAGPSTLVFDNGNWNISQTVTITAVDDAMIEGPHTSIISHTVSSADSNYNGIAVTDVIANITDNDAITAPPGDIFLPIIMAQTGPPGPPSPTFPDLAVQSIVATSNGVQVTIINEGNAPVVDEFWVDFYVDPVPPPTAVNHVWNDGRSTYGVAWGVTAPALPMNPGSTLTLIYSKAPGAPNTYYSPNFSNFPPTLSAGTPIYAQADSANTLTTYGGVLEDHEVNGGAYDNIKTGQASIASQTLIAEPLVSDQPKPILTNNLPPRSSK